MSARNAIRSVLIAAAISAAWSPIASSGPWLPAPGEHYTDFRAGYFSAGDFHGSDGHRRYFARGGVQEQRSLLAYNELGWKKNASVILGIPAASVTRRSADGLLDRTSTGLSDLQLGLRIKMADGPTALALELSLLAPMGYDRRVLLSPAEIRRADTTVARGLTGVDSSNAVRQVAPPRLGAGQQEVSATIQWGAPLPRLNGFIQLAHGFRHRGREFGGQAVFSADLGFWLGPSVLAAGRYLGSIDVGHAPDRADEVEEHLAGPVLLYRVDDRLDVYFASLHTAAARNAVHADRFYVGMSFRQTALNRLQGYLGGTRRP
jgi:hypothetical protein